MVERETGSPQGNTSNGSTVVHVFPAREMRLKKPSHPESHSRPPSSPIISFSGIYQLDGNESPGLSDRDEEAGKRKPFAEDADFVDIDSLPSLIQKEPARSQRPVMLRLFGSSHVSPRHHLPAVLSDKIAASDLSKSFEVDSVFQSGGKLCDRRLINRFVTEAVKAVSLPGYQGQVLVLIIGKRFFFLYNQFNCEP